MYAVEVRDHIMIGHSLPDPYFGPAQNMHGATFVVDVTFMREEMTRHNVVLDIGRASEVLKAVLTPLNYANLDEKPEFAGKLTTTEFLCRHIYDGLIAAAKSGALGEEAAGLARIRVTLHESHVARAWFEPRRAVIPIVFAVPGDINTPTGGYAYARQLLKHLPGQGLAVRHLPLPGGFPFPDARQRRQTAEMLSQIALGEVLLVDGLAFGAFDTGILEAVRAKIAVLLHHPLGLESGLSPEQSETLIASEKAALTHAERVIVTSPVTAAAVTELFAYPSLRIHVAVPGVEKASRAIGGGTIPHILSVGSLTPRKGHSVLVDALHLIRDMPWRCSIAGPLDLDRAEAAAVAEKIHHLRMTNRISLIGALPVQELDALYKSADLFALASHYEGYGMVFAEAMARGLPIVATTGGAVKDTVPAEAGVLVAPGDALALSRALGVMLEDAKLRRQYADASWAHAAALPQWTDTAQRVAAALREMTA